MVDMLDAEWRFRAVVALESAPPTALMANSQWLKAFAF